MEEILHLGSEAIVILAGLTLVRWTVKTFSKNDFDFEGPAKQGM